MKNFYQYIYETHSNLDEQFIKIINNIEIKFNFINHPISIFYLNKNKLAIMLIKKVKIIYTESLIFRSFEQYKNGTWVLDDMFIKHCNLNDYEISSINGLENHNYKIY